MSDPSNNDPAAAGRPAQMIALLCDELATHKRISRPKFELLCADKKILSPNEKTRNGDWSRTRDSVKLVLQKAGIRVDADSDKKEIYAPKGLKPQSANESHDTPAFNLEEGKAEKRYIGRMVATFLYESCHVDESVFLGSGTTMYYVGEQMCEYCREKGSPYPQKLFLSINVPLAELWCEAVIRPSPKISIPRGVLETGTRRFQTLQTLTEKEAQQDQMRWTPALVIVGADGVYHDKTTANEEIWLYGTSESVANNTNLFVQSAKTIVLYCLASAKITKGRNDGPKLAVPTSKTVVKVDRKSVV